MASKPAMDGKQRGQARATSKEDTPEQQTKPSNKTNPKKASAVPRATPHPLT